MAPQLHPAQNLPRGHSNSITGHQPTEEYNHHMVQTIFDSFTNLYSLTKTLRFELVPVGKTLECMRERLEYDNDLKTFMIDQEIEDGYQKLKPHVDSLHEEFINDALNTSVAKQLNINSYFTTYKEKGELQKEESNLRDNISKAFLQASELWKVEKYKQYTWKKGSKVALGPSILASPDTLLLIKDKNSDDEELKKVIDETFKGFFTYFGGFNTNRENYY